MTIDHAVLDALLDVTGGDVEFVESLIATYVGDAPTLIAALRQAAAAGDVAAVVLPAHSLASTSITMGATSLGETCRALEHEARAGAVDDLAARVEAIATAFDAVRDELAGVRLEARSA
jgi:HPt (histidine-containing phosphotransfer) domain-containing protein